MLELLNVNLSAWPPFPVVIQYSTSSNGPIYLHFIRCTPCRVLSAKESAYALPRA
jgi:hypothetical protein